MNIQEIVKKENVGGIYRMESEFFSVELNNFDVLEFILISTQINETNLGKDIREIWCTEYILNTNFEEVELI